jgi:pyridoxal phosphate enzyme (YggS family)
MDAEVIRRNIHQVEERIQRACERAGRDRRQVQLIGVSKTFPAEYVTAAIAAGVRVFGENRLQEAVQKFGRVEALLQENSPTPPLPADSLGRRKFKLHLIGHLQSNKAKPAAEIFDMIQTVDRLEIAVRLDRCCEQLNRLLPVLIQVNLGNEETKSGARPSEAMDLVKQVAGLKNLRVRGLMAIPPLREQAEDSRADFRVLRELAGSIAHAGTDKVSMNELSMGMSHDFETAIEEGATMIRVGTGIFGTRT